MVLATVVSVYLVVRNKIGHKIWSRILSNSGKQLRKNYILFLLFAIAGVLFLFVFSWTTSPVYDLLTKDSDIFVLMGQFTKEGMIPYKDFFDHKGPVLIFIQWLGVMLGKGKIGVFLLQCVAMVFTLCGMYKLSGIFLPNKRSVWISILSLMLICMYLGGGNLTEEYCLPFIVWSVYFGLKYLATFGQEFKKNEIDHKSVAYNETMCGGGHDPKWSIFYGVTFGVCAFTRITNALPLCCIMLVGFVVLIKKKMVKNILYNVCCFVAGALIVMLPFIIYCAVNGVLSEMIYATFTYNFRYAASGSYLTFFGKIKAMNFRIVPIVLTGVIGICGLVKRKKLYEACFLVISSVIATLFQFSGNGYEHYLLVWVPVVVVAVCMFITYWEHENCGKREGVSVLSIVAVVFMVSVLARTAMEIRKSYIALDNAAEKVFAKEIHQIVDMMDEDYEDENFENENHEEDDYWNKDYENDGYSVIAYNVYPYFYLESGLKPCYKYFIMQDWQCGKDMEMYYDAREDFNSLEADYIVMYTHQDRSNTYFGGIIEEYYTEVGRTERLKVLRRE